jgi:hypothetical protein
MRLAFRSAFVLSFAAAIAIGVAPPIGAQSTLERQLRDRIGGSSNTGNANLNERDASSGIKEALAQGVDRSIRQLGRTDGFLQDQAVKILVPEKLRRVADLARRAGAGRQVDEFETSMNRAAEKAVPAAASILSNAVRQMSVQDAIGLVRGGNTSATDFFRRSSEQKLFEAFRPIVARQTAQVGVTQKYKAFSEKAGGGALGALMGGGSSSSPADLDDYVTREAIDGLFSVIAEQEKQIRSNPAARTTDLLRRVFR